MAASVPPLAHGGMRPSRLVEAMHELSIAMHMVEQAVAAAETQHAAKVASVHCRLGALSGVVKDALLFAWDTATLGTICEGSRLDIEDVPIRVRCPAEGSIHTLDFPPVFRCPSCGVATPELISGKELELDSLEWTE